MATAAPNPNPSLNPGPTAAKFRIDVAIHDLLMSNAQGPAPAASMGLELPEPVFPLHPERLADPGPEVLPSGSCSEKGLTVFRKRSRQANLKGSL